MIKGMWRSLPRPHSFSFRMDEEGSELEGSEAFGVVASPIFSLELSQNLHSGLARQRSGLLRDEAQPGALGGDTADIHRLLSLSRPQTDFEAQVLAAVRKLKLLSVSEPEGFSTMRLAQLLQERGYLVSVRSGQPKECGKSCGRQCLEKLHHTYILVTGSLDSAVTTQVIVEAQFREHFAIAHQTPTYAMLLAAAPVEFIGSAARLAALVELMSVGVAAAFQDQGLPLPPWRRARSVLSKWALGQDGHGSMDGETPMKSPSKRAAGQALPLPGLRGAGTRARADAVRRDALTASNAPAAAAQAKGLGGLLDGVGANIGRGKRQALELSRRRSDGPSEIPMPLVVSLSAHASTGMPLEPLPQTPPHASVDAPSNASRNALTEIISSLEDRTLAVSAAAEQILTLNANQQRGSALHERHQQSGLQQQFREAKGKESSKQRPDAGCIVSGGITRGMTTAAEQQKREPASEGASPKAAAAARPKAVSLLAQGLAREAAQPAPSTADITAKGAKTKQRSQSSWLLGLPHITTVRRTGKAGPDGRP